MTLELTYLLVENDGSPLLEVDKLNGVYKVNGVDMLAGISELTDKATKSKAKRAGSTLCTGGG